MPRLTYHNSLRDSYAPDHANRTNQQIINHRKMWACGPLPFACLKTLNPITLRPRDTGLRSENGSGRMRQFCWHRSMPCKQWLLCKWPVPCSLSPVHRVRRCGGVLSPSPHSTATTAYCRDTNCYIPPCLSTVTATLTAIEVLISYPVRGRRGTTTWPRPGLRES
uniref:Uncharacterized protein n=1 Tax=Anopheles darlingi TaxID=43151 RepID=A0A2M4CW64_ANODA